MHIAFIPIWSNVKGREAILPPNFWQALWQKLGKPVTILFLTINSNNPKYVNTSTSKKENC